LVAGKERRQFFQKLCSAPQQVRAMTIFFREFELKAQPMFTIERRPVVFRCVDLRRGADGVVAMPAETRMRRAVHGREVPAQELTVPGTGSDVEIFEHQIDTASASG